MIFTDFRRELIARTLFDLLKIAIAAALASRFFFDFPPVVKLWLWVGMGAVAIVAILMCPVKKQEG